MKILKLFSIFFVLVFVTIILQSCSNENIITSPPTEKENNTSMKKTTTISQAKVSSSSGDTVIYLPISKKTLTVSRSLSAEKIAMLDKYFSNHKIPTRNKTIKPYIQDCSTYYEYEWENENQFSPVSGKLLGIWQSDDIITLDTARITYGFSLAYATGFNSISKLEGANYADPNIMVGIGDPTVALGQVKNYNKCGYYEIDEPLSFNYSPTDTKKFEDTINAWDPGGKVMLTDYNWPSEACCNFWAKDAGLWLAQYQGSNYYMMCDKYDGTCCGSPCDYWDEFSNYYNPAHVISNWAKNQMWQTSNWDCCFKLANGSDQNIVQIWLYADSVGDISSVQTFCGYAWQNGWLLRLQKQIEIIWKCDDPQPCTNCDWYNNKGNWYVYDTFYTGQQRYAGY